MSNNNNNKKNYQMETDVGHGYNRGASLVSNSKHGIYPNLEHI